MQTRKKYILAKIESTYGTDPTPVAANAILTTGLQRSLYEGNTVSRELDRSTLGAYATVNTGPYAMVEFNVELAGAGSAGTVPGYGVLLRACGFAETITAATSVRYQPVSSGYESCTIYYDRDGERQIIAGCRGTVAIEMTVGNYPTLKFRMTGLYAKPAAATAVTPNTAVFQTPLPVNHANTGTCKLDNYNLRLQTLNLAMNAETPYLDLVNTREVLYVDRQPSGDLTFLAPSIATKDIMALVESHAGTVTTSALELIHGATAGNIVEIDAPKTQLSGLSETDISGELGYQTNAILLPDSAGDDEIQITIR